jgi:hypothetical protein
MSKRILRHRQADRSSNYGRYGIHPTHQPVHSSTRHHAPRFGCPFSISNPADRVFFIERTLMCLVRARRDKTAFPRVNPGLSFPGPLGRKTDAKQIHPAWDPLREDRRFAKLLAKLAPKKSKKAVDASIQNSSAS